MLGVVESLFAYALLSWVCMQVNAKCERFLVTEPQSAVAPYGVKQIYEQKIAVIENSISE